MGAQAMSTLDEVISEVLGYKNLAPGWDGADSVPAPYPSVKFACELLRTIPEGYTMPKPMLSRNGTVGFYWSNRTHYVDLQIDANERVSALVVLSKEPRQDKWFDALTMEEFTQAWYEEHLAVFREVAHA
jgi:hypothetical protein